MKQRLGVGLRERHDAVANFRQCLLVDVVDADSMSLAGEDQRQRQADVPRAADNTDVRLIGSAAEVVADRFVV